MKSIFSLIFCLCFATTCFGQDDIVLDTSTFDRSIRPQDDLYFHVNGKWLERTKIPADKSNFGSFIELADLSQERIKTLIEELAKRDHPAGSDSQKVSDFYKSFMNEEVIEERGFLPLESHLQAIRELKTKDDIFETFGMMQRFGVGSPIAFFVSQDAKKSTEHLAQTLQSGLSLPDRDYYLKDDDKSVSARKALRAYISKLFELTSLQNANKAAEEILALETKIAEASWARVELREAEKRYNKYQVSALNEMADLPWMKFLAAAGADQITTINVWTPSYFEKFVEIFNSTERETWINYMQFRLIDAAAPYMSKDFVDAHFQLHSKELAGIEAQQPRWKRGVDATAGAGAGDFGIVGEIVGKLYVERHFPPEAKAQMDQLVKNLLKSFGSSINDLTWMTDETKKRAQEKLAKINTKIGYPSKWRDYSKLEIKPDDLFGNIMRSNSVEYQRMLDKLGQPVDRDEWGMTPQTVNAYYNPSLNEIVFPAAILQPPFFDPKAPRALNYGGIGAVIGHEISHAFDDQGSQYDGDGNLKNWWTDKDREAFESLTKRLIEQYSGYEPLPGRKVNGQFTLGENIADLSGLAISHKAFSISQQEEKAKGFAGWTPDQLFFVGWSRVWQRKYRDDEMIRRLRVDPHSPSQFRANGPVMNIDAFYMAFDLKEGDRLFKNEKDRIKIW